LDKSATIENSAVSRRQLAWQDVKDSIRLWRVWATLGWSDILQRYQRSIIGPFWLTASMAVMVIALGVLYSELLRIDIADLMPFVCVGILVWGFVSSVLNEAGSLFTTQALYIKQIRLPYTVYVWRFVWSKAIIFAHNFVIYLLVMLNFRVWPGGSVLLAVPAMALVFFNALLVALYVGMISTRFRDIPQIINSITQVVFFVTPVFWKPELLGRSRFVVDWNPFYHVIEIVRAPLLGRWPSTVTIEVVLGITVFNLVMVFLFFPRFRARIAYWI
jgi:ABC-2 type transport system permease protein/lipopolysaccharide transport system permease protein